MIVTEYFKTREDGVKLYKTYSNEGYKILQVETGIQYDEAVDVENAPYTYEETDVLIEKPIGSEENPETAVTDNLAKKLTEAEEMLDIIAEGVAE